jgi:trimeric autotransporter adhesin
MDEKKSLQGSLAVLLLLAMAMATPRVVGGADSGSPAGSRVANEISGFAGNAVDPDVAGAVVAGGGRPAFPNRVSGDFGTVGGGEGNVAGDRSVVGGGSQNLATGFRSVVGGGSFNQATVEHSTVGGGTDNTASATRTTVAGGCRNVASHLDATVGGGSGNIASFTHATVSGGTKNTASSLDTTVSGGSGNTAGGPYATVSGGSNNIASAFGAVVGGGSGNEVSSGNGTAGGGLGNHVLSNYSTVAGGLGNVAGRSNGDQTNSFYATIAGGIDNRAGGAGSTVGGGSNNRADGAFSTVPGGFSSSAQGDYSFAAGRRARVAAAHSGVFLVADSKDADFKSAAPDELAARATGGVRLVTAIDELGETRAGVRLAGGSSSWESLSDRNAKAGITPVDTGDILRRLSTIPISTWSYKDQTPSTRHIGPMAQDFRAAFATGEDDRYISAVDADGVALAAIQGLYQLALQREGQIAAQQNQIADLEKELASQRKRLAVLEAWIEKKQKAAGD